MRTLISFILILALTGCKKKVENTSIVIEDPQRHYYALTQGTDLEITWRIANVGKDPLVLTDIQPSCGCISHDLDDNNIVPAGKEATLKFTFRTEKYVGYVHHTIRLFGNIKPDGMATMTFDTNVVPPSPDNPAYEELYKERRERDISAGVEELVDGTMGQKGYWTDTDKQDSRNYEKYPWRDVKKD